MIAVAFRDHGWRVIAVDVRRPPAAAVAPGATAIEWILADVRRLPLGVALRGQVDLLWASPPCTEFSTANARIDRRTNRPSLELLHATFETIADLRPKFWVIENVNGAIPFFGIPVQKIGPFCLWGYFPWITASPAAALHRKWSSGRTAAARAAIPYALSNDLYQAVTRSLGEKSLLDLRPLRRHRVVRRRTAEPDLFARASA